MSRLHEQYSNQIKDAMMKKFEYSNIMQVPKLEKIVINMGVGEAKENKKMLKPEEAATKDRIQIDYDDAKDEIAAEFIFLYPPGIPLVVPGEVIDKYVIDKIRQYEQYNMKVIGLDDHKIYIINR